MVLQALRAMAPLLRLKQKIYLITKARIIQLRMPYIKRIRVRRLVVKILPKTLIPLSSNQQLSKYPSIQRRQQITLRLLWEPLELR